MYFTTGENNKKLLLKLCCETAKYRVYLERLLKLTGGVKLLKLDPIRRNHYVALVILYELVIGQGVANTKCGKVFKGQILGISKIIDKDVMKLKADGVTHESLALDSMALKVPRYVRVNTLKILFSDALKKLEKEGFTIHQLEINMTQEEFRKKIEKMDSKMVYIDLHVENMLIFTPRIDLHNFWISEDCFVLQDKASCLPSIVLKPEPDSHVMDVCAAPGMKTTHLAAILNNKGKIFAFDRNNERTKKLSEMLKKEGVNNAVVANSDFLKIDVQEQRFNKVKFALVDPPCSGSGMIKRGAFLDEFEKPNERRLRSLANLQTMILKHALQLPHLVRCVYSTCSIHNIENEGVVQEILADEKISREFELVENPLPGWDHRGSTEFDFSQKCLRASPNQDLTNGFFVAVFQRKS